MLHFRILGPLEVADESGVIELGGLLNRKLLAALLLRANEIVPTDSLYEALWGAKPPKAAKAALHNHVSDIRNLIGAATIETRAPGYRLRIKPEQLDAARFEQLLDRSRTQPPDERAQTLAEALALWRGEPLADLAFEEFAQAEIQRLLSRRLEASIERIDAELACGRHSASSRRLRAWSRPTRSRQAHEPLLIALYRSGRQRDAMKAYQRHASG